MKIYSVSDDYIDYLHRDEHLKRVFLNQSDNYNFSRKYLGAVIEVNGFSYYIPFSSPKKSDYIQTPDGTNKIRDSVPIIVRMTAVNEKNEIELRGTLKICSMIPVPPEKLEYYDFQKEKYSKYRELIKDEYDFILKNADMIVDYANLVYRQRSYYSEISLDNVPNIKPNYIRYVVPFRYAEQKCLEYCKTVLHQHGAEKDTAATLSKCHQIEEWGSKLEQKVEQEHGIKKEVPETNRGSR